MARTGSAAGTIGITGTIGERPVATETQNEEGAAIRRPLAYEIQSGVSSSP
jgi:hypothetical protein